MSSLERGLEALRKEVASLVTVHTHKVAVKESLTPVPVSPLSDAGTSRRTHGSKTSARPSGPMNTSTVSHPSPALQIMTTTNNDDLDLTTSKTVSDGRRYRDQTSEDLRPPLKRPRSDRVVGDMDGHQEAFERCVDSASKQADCDLDHQFHLEEHLGTLLFRSAGRLPQPLGGQIPL